MPYTPPPWNSLDFSSRASPYTPMDWSALDFSSASTPGSSGSLSASLGFTSDLTGVLTVGGALSAALEFRGSLLGSVSNVSGEITATLNLSSSISGFQDWLSVLPPVKVQEVYRLVITGAKDGFDDLAIGQISSWQATSQSGSRASYVQAVIPAANEYMSEISARQSGELVIEKGYRFESGAVRYEEILRSRFDTLRPDRGGRGITATLSGYMTKKALQSGARTVAGVRSISSSNGKRRVRCDIDLFLKPGMTVTAVDETFEAGYINYYVSQTDKFCEIGER